MLCRVCVFLFLCDAKARAHAHSLELCFELVFGFVLNRTCTRAHVVGPGAVPIGLVASDWGGQAIQVFMSPEALHRGTKPELRSSAFKIAGFVCLLSLTVTFCSLSFLH